MVRIAISAAVFCCLVLSSAEAQPRPHVFVGAIGGLSTLSADARAEITSGAADVSLYKPENGPAVNVFFGVQLHDYLAVQSNYVWNRNDVALTSVHATERGPSVHQRAAPSSQHALVGDLLVYFREPRSTVRPYLSAGAGVVRFTSTTMGDDPVGEAALSSARVQTTGALVRVAVGIDFALTGGWRARYSFSESLSDNSLSAQLSPAGQRKLANFQNLVGLLRTF